MVGLMRAARQPLTSASALASAPLIGIHFMTDMASGKVNPVGRALRLGSSMTTRIVSRAS